MKKIALFFLLALLGLQSAAHAYSSDILNNQSTCFSLTITSGSAGDTAATSSAVSISTTAGIGGTSSSSYTPVAVQFSATSAIQYDFGYTTYTPAVLSGYVAASTTAWVSNLDPYLVLYIQGATATANWRLNIFAVRK